jgi:serine/threonine protein phosphatase PrpC
MCGTDLDDPLAIVCQVGQAVVYSHRSITGHKTNEDALGVFEWGDGKLLLAIADGVGGLPGGAAAARRVLETLHKPPAGEHEDPIVYLLDKANDSIRQDISTGATTLSAVLIQNKRFTGYHAGDSTTLVVGQRGRVKFQSVCHSPVGVAQARGELSERAALFHPQRHLLSNMLGDEAFWVERSDCYELATFDTIVIASDGLWDNFFCDEIIDIVCQGTLVQAGRRLAHSARRRMLTVEDNVPSKPDDLSFVLYRRQNARDTSDSTL